LIWLLGILIGTIFTVGGALYSQISALNASVSTFTTRLTVFEDRIQRLDSIDQKIIERLDRIEGRR
jgi:hypothetical protein